MVLPLDQGEELFGPDAGLQGPQFLDLLAQLLDRGDGLGLGMVVVSTNRADRYEAVQAAPALAGLDSVVFDSLKPMPLTRFKEVILGPASRSTAAGRVLEIDSELVNQLLADCEQGADALPLLALTLALLYRDYGGSGKLTLAGYEAMGGVAQVVQTEIGSLLASDPIVLEIFVVTPAMFSSIGQGPGEPIDFDDDKGHRPHGQPPRLSLGPGLFFSVGQPLSK